jgi:transcriptional regulator with XRE-family HTH domain
VAERNSPMVRRRRLGLELRRLREAAGKTGDEVAEHLGWSASKVSRIETGRIAAAWGDVSDLLDLYEVTDIDIRQTLLGMARQTKEKGWWQSFGDVLSTGYATLIGFETAARELHVFEPLTVPGLLQTPDYAHAVMRNGATDLSDEEIDRRVQVRLSRQAVLDGDDALKLWAILDEAVLTRQIGGPQVMGAQLTHLAELARRPGITIQVISFNQGAHAAMTGAFGIFEFPGDDPDIAYIDSITGELYLERPSDVRIAKDTLQRLRAAAAPIDTSLRLITQAARSYQK